MCDSTPEIVGHWMDESRGAFLGGEVIPMPEHSAHKKSTQKVVISDPNEELLEMRLEGRTLSPELSKFLKTLIKPKKWTKNITIPSMQESVAVVLLFTSSLKQAGLEILSEIHVYYHGKIFVEIWEMLPEFETPASLPPGIFGSVDVGKVRVKNPLVYVEMKVQVADGVEKRVLKTYDFSQAEPAVATRQMSHDEAMP